MQPSGRLALCEKPGGARKHGPVCADLVEKPRVKSPLKQSLSAPAQSSRGLAVISSQKPRSFETRSVGGFPAIMAELMAPLEMPATQSGCRFASASAS